MDLTKIKNYEALPDRIWEHAIKQANRSTLVTFKTGATIFDVDNEIIKGGTSHHEHETHTTHAEEHAMSQLTKYTEYTKSLSILVVTLGKNGNFAYSSCPCIACAEIMYQNLFVSQIYYADKTIDGNWRLNIESANELLNRVQRRPKDKTFAREMRIQ